MAELLARPCCSHRELTGTARRPRAQRVARAREAALRCIRCRQLWRRKNRIPFGRRNLQPKPALRFGGPHGRYAFRHGPPTDSAKRWWYKRRPCRLCSATSPAKPMVQTVAASTRGEVPAHGNGDARPKAGFWALTLGSLGVVYGDIGTSPLYALREAVVAATGPGDGATEPAVLGVLSLILWALLLVVTAKYVLILLRLDNNGEGGTLALMALAQRAMGRAGPIVFLLGVSSAALFYGDAIITPAISVLSAIEGLKVVAPGFDHYVVPITVAILCGLFLVQSRGTARVATFFGPVMVLWFVAIALGGLSHISDNPSVLRALNPGYGIAFLLGHGFIALVTLGLVFLAVTGAEALYADLGHFGRR